MSENMWSDDAFLLSGIQSLLESLRSTSEKTVPSRNPGSLQKFFPISGEAESPQDLIKYLERYLQLATHLRDPRYLGHQVSIPHPAALFGDLVQSLSNNSLAVADMGAAGLALERNLVEWFLSKIGWKGPAAGGFLTHGGSLANLTALLAARASATPKSWAEGVDPAERGVFLMSDTTHYCLSRAVSIMGFGDRSIQRVACRSDGSMDLGALERTISRVQSEKRKIIAVIATAGCTVSGAFDPLDEIATLLRDQKIWFHVDGAHGASILLSRKHQSLVKGIEKADSVVWDAHKMLRAPSLCTALLFRDRRNMFKTFQQEASYLSEAPLEEGPHSYPYTLECTRPSLALKFYPVLLSMGDRGLESYLDNLVERTTEFHRWLQVQPDFDAPVLPQMNILLFRKRGLSNSEQQGLYDKVLDNGHFHITFARLGTDSYLRLTLMNPDSRLQDFQELTRELREG